MISIIWTLILFIALGVAATDFLCPALFMISKSLNMSQSVAGVTLIAFGNGSPDVFAAIAGMMQGRPALVIGGLFGGGCFVVMMVLGTIFSVKSFKLLPHPFLRDITFYLIAVSWIFYLFVGPRMITIYDAVGKDIFADTALSLSCLFFSFSNYSIISLIALQDFSLYTSPMSYWLYAVDSGRVRTNKPLNVSISLTRELRKNLYHI